MVYLLLDCDEYLGAQRLAKLSAALGDPEMAGLNTTELAGGKTSAAEILGHAAMMPFLTPRRLVTVHGYLSHLDKRMAASKGTDSAAHAEAAALLEGLPDAPESCDLVFVDSGVDKRRGLWRGFKINASGDKAARAVPGLDALVKTKAVQMEDAGTPDAKALPSWIQRRARERKIAIDGRAVQQLANFVGPNLRQLDNELGKLSTYAGERPIQSDDVMLLVSDASEAMIWDLTDALSQRNGRRAMLALHSLRRADAHALYLLTMIARQYRIILKVKEAMGAIRGGEQEIATLVGERPYPVRKAMQQAQAYSLAELEGIMNRLLEADFAMKTGADADTEIDVLIAELTQRR